MDLSAQDLAEIEEILEDLLYTAGRLMINLRVMQRIVSNARYLAEARKDPTMVDAPWYD